LDGFRAIKEGLENRNISVVAASSDPQDKAAAMATSVGLPIGFGVDKELIESLGGYWQATRQFAQPAEFLLDPNNKIVQLSYSDGPLARTEAADVIKLVDHLSKSLQEVGYMELALGINPMPVLLGCATTPFSFR